MSGAERIQAAFHAAKRDDRAAFVPYLTGGWPDAERFLEHARTLTRYADLLEVGMPYSDPLGDGPTIQRASEEALRAGATVASTFAGIRRLRSESEVPIALMTYVNPILRYRAGGTAGFVRDLAAAGGDGLILPDLPPDEAEELIAAAREHGVATTFLVAPTSTDARLRTVTAACDGFVYAVSVTGVTGEREVASTAVPELVRRLRSISDLPVAVGFGVRDAATAAPVAAVADGVVVGSAVIRCVAEGSDLAALCASVREACQR